MAFPICTKATTIITSSSTMGSLVVGTSNLKLVPMSGRSYSTHNSFTNTGEGMLPHIKCKSRLERDARTPSGHLIGVKPNKGEYEPVYRCNQRALSCEEALRSECRRTLLVMLHLLGQLPLLYHLKGSHTYIDMLG